MYSAIKHYLKLLLGYSDLDWNFHKFENKIHPQTWRQHDFLLNWAQDYAKNFERYEVSDFYIQSEDLVVQQGYYLREKVKREYENKYADLKQLRILIHVPSMAHSPGGYSLFTNLAEGLQYVGIATRNLEWNDSIENALEEFKPTIFITSDNTSYLSRINWKSIAEYRKKNQFKLGLTASIDLDGNSLLDERLAWARQHQVDFYYCFRAPEFIHEHYQPFFTNGYPVFSVEFGANPMTYYPVPNIKRDLDYVFFGSSNYDKWPRYFAYFTKLLTKNPGFIDGPGWSKIRHWSSEDKNPNLEDITLRRNLERYLYARAKVGINLHVNISIDYPSELNERTYMLAACGVPQLVDNARLLPLRFQPISMFIADNPLEYKRLFNEIKNNPEEAQKRALQAQREVFEKHTVFHRAEQFIKDLIKLK